MHQHRRYTDESEMANIPTDTAMLLFLLPSEVLGGEFPLASRALLLHESPYFSASLWYGLGTVTSRI